MKKILTVVMLFCIVLCVSNGCKNRNLPVEDYPLSANAIEKALQEWGISCTLEENDWINKRPGQTMYTIMNPENNQFIAGVSSGLKNGERILMLAFPPHYAANSVPFSEAESAIVFATSLFGGFKGTHEVYDVFMQEYDTINTQKKRYQISERRSATMREGESIWQRNIGSITCKITFDKPALNETQEYLGAITIASKWDEFYSK